MHAKQMLYCSAMATKSDELMSLYKCGSAFNHPHSRYVGHFLLSSVTLYIVCLCFLDAESYISTGAPLACCSIL